MARRSVRLRRLLLVSTRGERRLCQQRPCGGSSHQCRIRDLGRTRFLCQGCRLDERGLAAASQAIDKAIVDRVDVVVMDRFGGAESLGGSLFASLASAVATGWPVLTAVRAPYDMAWMKFHRAWSRIAGGPGAILELGSARWHSRQLSGGLSLRGWIPSSAFTHWAAGA